MIEVNKRLEEIDSMYEDSVNTPMSALILGGPGVGKTSLALTGPKPILVDSFDPRGTVILRKFKQEHPKDLYIRTFWNEDSQKPTEYMKWERTIDKDLSTNFLSEFGTYSCDTFTTMLDALTNATASAKNRVDNLPAIQDYRIIYNTVRDIIKKMASQSCVFLMMGHIEFDKNDLTGEVTASIAAFKGLKTIVPPLFTEKYVLLVKNMRDENGKAKRVLLTDHKGMYSASTQIGAGIFQAEEEPNIKSLLLKAGLPYNDKMIINTKEVQNV